MQHVLDATFGRGQPAAPPMSSCQPARCSAPPSHAGMNFHGQAAADRLGFWAQQARRLVWRRPFDVVLDASTPPVAQWFKGGTLNVSVNCVDRHVAAGRGDRIALHWIGELGETRDVTYGELLDAVGRAANHLRELGLRRGDRVVIYMPKIPEAVIAMLACVRLGVIHAVVSLQCSPRALADRIADAGAKLVVTADARYCAGQRSLVKADVDRALDLDERAAALVEKVLVVRRECSASVTNWLNGRDIWWHESVDRSSARHRARAFDAERPLFLLYPDAAAGSRAVVHSSGGYLTQAHYTFRYVFDHEPGADVYWCDADIESITGHTYGVYGPLSDGATSLLYEGTPDWPGSHRLFEIIEKYGVTAYYASSDAIPSFAERGGRVPTQHDLSSLRLIGATNELADADTCRWLHNVLGRGRCPVVDTWSQTETGGVVLSSPGVSVAEAGPQLAPLPGFSAHIVDEDANLVGTGQQGNLVLDRPWPAMLRGMWGGARPRRAAHWSRFPRQPWWYFTGYGASYDDEDAIRMLDRLDDADTDRLAV